MDLKEKARNYAFLLLKFRLRSEEEIYKRLKKKKFGELIVKETVLFLKEKNFINDELFAREWIQSRLKKPLGLLRIKAELKLKGIDNQIIDKQLKKAKEAFMEAEVVRKIAEEKFKKLKGVEINKAKQRIYGYLFRRGFSPPTIMDAVRQL